MRKSAIAVCTLFILAALPLFLSAQDDAKKDEDGAVTLTGEPLDLKCYMAGGKSGEGHAACAAKCARGGQGIAFLVMDGDKKHVYLLLNKDGKPPVDQVVDYMGKQVKLTGAAKHLGGLNVITVEKVEKVEKAEAAA